MDYEADPLGARVIVRDITPAETKTKGGILIPEFKGAPPDENLGMVRNSPALRIVEVLALGEGRADPTTGKYTNGSRLEVGGKYLMRSGAMSQQHMDALPGRPDQFMVLEDTLVGRVRLVEAKADRPKLAVVT